MDAPLHFGDWLRRRRKSLDLTQGQLAKQIHCSLIAIKRIEASDLVPSRQLAEMLARALHVPDTAQAEFIAFARTPHATARVEAFKEPAPISTPPAKQFHLPAPLTGLIGRERDVDAACELILKPQVRLVTLTGPPGTGKTRLALAMARQLETQFRDGVCFVPLAPISDPALVVPAIAHTLEIRESSGKDLLVVAREFLRDKQLVLVLDNFEQIVSAAPRVVELLNSAPAVKAIVTSREILQVYGEYEFPVPPLQLPDVRHLPPLTALEHYSAIELFVERAQAIKPRFALTDANARHIAEICAWLDGLPLALEMAAAQIRWHTPSVLLAQLRSRLATLTGGPRDLTPRQQTLRGAIDWSYDLLRADERALFAHLAVFVESCTLDAALAVWGDSDSERAVQLLRGLVDKSLLRAEAPARFAMLETIREYAQEQLERAGQLEIARERHAHYFLQRAEHLREEWSQSGERQLAALAELDADYLNCRAAMQWTLAPAREPELGLRFAIALYFYWETRGQYREAYELTGAALKRAPQPSALRARALARASYFARWLGEQSQAMTLLHASIELYETLDDPVGLAETLATLAINYGMQLDYARAVVEFQRALEIYRRLNHLKGIANVSGNLALALMRLNQIEQAEAAYTEALAARRASDDWRGIAHNLSGLAEIAWRRGDLARAEELFKEGLAYLKRVGHQRSVAHTLASLGQVIIQRGRHAPGVQLLGASRALKAAIGVQDSAPAERATQDALDAAHAALGQAAVEQLLAHGAQLEPDQVWALADV